MGLLSFGAWDITYRCYGASKLRLFLSITCSTMSIYSKLIITTFLNSTPGVGLGKLGCSSVIESNLRRYLGVDRDYVASRTVHLL